MNNKNEIIEESICKIDEYGNKYWRLNGELHRENHLPAIEKYNGTKFWYLNGELHREKGPAIEYIDGREYWFWHGEEIEVNSQKEFEKKLRSLKQKAHDFSRGMNALCWVN